MEKSKNSAFHVLSNQEIIGYGFLRSVYRGDFIIALMGLFLGLVVVIVMTGSAIGMAGNSILFTFLVSMLTTLAVPIVPILFELLFAKGTILHCEVCRSVFQGRGIGLFGHRACHHNIWNLESKNIVPPRWLLLKVCARSSQSEGDLDLDMIQEKVRREPTTLRMLSGGEILVHSFFQSLRNGGFVTALLGTFIGALIGTLTLNVEIRGGWSGIGLMVFVGLLITLFSPFIWILTQFPFLRGELFFCRECGSVLKKGHIMETQFTECELHNNVWELK